MFNKIASQRPKASHTQRLAGGAPHRRATGRPAEEATLALVQPSVFCWFCEAYVAFCLLGWKNRGPCLSWWFNLPSVFQRWKEFPNGGFGWKDAIGLEGFPSNQRCSFPLRVCFPSSEESLCHQDRSPKDLPSPNLFPKSHSPQKALPESDSHPKDPGFQLFPLWLPLQDFTLGVYLRPVYPTTSVILLGISSYIYIYICTKPGSMGGYPISIYVYMGGLSLRKPFLLYHRSGFRFPLP